MKVYISGPMSGKPAFNIPVFDEYAKKIRALGYEVVSPAELDSKKFRRACLSCVTGDFSELPVEMQTESWGDLLARDVKLLADGGIEGIVVLDGWEKSRGALLETFVGRLCGLQVYYYSHNSKQLIPVLRRKLEDVHGAMRIEPTVYSVSDQYLPPEMREKAAVEAINTPSGMRERPPLAPRLRQALEDERIAAERRVITEPRSSGEVRVVSETGGEKGEKGAVIGDLCPKALKAVAEVAGFGRIKYNRLNYLKGFDWSLSYDAAQRHLMEFWAGNDTDEESGLPHLAHAAWQCLCLLAFSIRGLGKDDRP